MGFTQEPLVIYWWNARPTTPNTMHLYIYRQVEECLGIEGDWDGLLWYVSDFILRADFVRLAGLWVTDPRRIMLAEDKVNDPSVVSHEIIHDLTNGKASEGDPVFERCEIKPL